MKRHFLSNREIREFKSLLDKFGIVTESKKLIIEENDHSIIYDEKIPILIKYNDSWLPSLKIMLLQGFPAVTIDDGAQAKIRNGAKLYSAGIQNITGQIKKGLTCVIRDLRDRNIGSALVESDPSDIIEKKKGAYLIVYELYS
jgi:predicted ribosome-associated RNA-binding protein Tma20